MVCLALGLGVDYLTSSLGANQVVVEGGIRVSHGIFLGRQEHGEADWGGERTDSWRGSRSTRGPDLWVVRSGNRLELEGEQWSRLR